MFLTARRVSITTNTVSCLRLFIATCHGADRLWYQDLDGDHARHHTGLKQSPHSPLENHRKLRLEGTFESHLVQPPAQAGTPRTGWPGPYPGTFWIPPRREMAPPPWETCASAQSRTQHRSAFCVQREPPVCAHCLLPWHWAWLKTAWLQPLCTFL